MPWGARKRARFPVDGQMLTTDEIAALMGVSVAALARRKSINGGCSYQLLVDMQRRNEFGGYHDRKPRYFIDGEWLTVVQCAERAGVAATTITNWRSLHRDADGGRPSMAEAVEHYRRLKSGAEKRAVRVGRKYMVRGKWMTVDEAAAKYGAAASTLRSYMKKHHCTLETAVRRYEERKKRQAVKAIMDVLNGR